MRRRTFLKMSLYGSSLLGLGGAALWAWPTLRRFTPRRPLVAIAPERFAVLAAVASRVVRAPGADPVAIAHRVDEMLALVPPETGGDINRLLALLENGLAGLLLDGRLRPFSRLAGDDQDGALRSFRDSRLAPRRAGYHSLRKLCCAAHYAGEATWADVGYPGPPQLSTPPDPPPPTLPSELAGPARPVEPARPARPAPASGGGVVKGALP